MQVLKYIDYRIVLIKMIFVKPRGFIMAISTAVQRGSWVYVYGEKGQQLTSIAGELHGFTGSSVSVKRGNWVYVYDEHGHQQGTFPC